MARRKKHAQIHLVFADEAPAIGCGKRGVDVLQIGRKWVRLQCHSSGRRARIKIADWQALVSARRNQEAYAALSKTL